MMLVASSAYCEDKDLFPTSEFKLGYQGMYIHYEEPDLMKEKGSMHGGFGSWTGQRSNDSRLDNCLWRRAGSGINQVQGTVWQGEITGWLKIIQI